MKIDRDGAKATGLLKRVYQRDGVQYGVMRFKVRIPYRDSAATEEPEDGQEVARFVEPVSGGSTPPAPLAKKSVASKPDVRDLELLELPPSNVSSPPRLFDDPREPAPALVKQKLPKLLDESSGQPTGDAPAKAAAANSKEGLREMVIEIISDQPIDGSFGPTQAECRMQLTKTQITPIDADVALKMEIDIRVLVHEKTTPDR